jgi:hypothetical protein
MTYMIKNITYKMFIYIYCWALVFDSFEYKNKAT